LLANNIKEEEFFVLKVTNVDWDKDREDIEKLPTEPQLQWGLKNSTVAGVSDWVSKKFD